MQVGFQKEHAHAPHWLGLFAAALAGVVFLAGTAQAQELWRGAQYGMTTEEVLWAIHGARFNPTPERAPIGVLSVTYEDPQPTGNPATADFWFVDGGLSEVHVNFDPKDANATVFSNVKQTVSIALGVKPTCTAAQQCEWKTDAQAVVLKGDFPKTPSMALIYALAPLP